MPKKDGRPRGRMTAYAFFVQTCREEHKKKHPDEQVVFAEFSRKCADKWKVFKDMGGKDKKRFEDMAAKDKIRYENDMANYTGPGKGEKRKRKKDPNAPKRALSAFFFFCADERGAVKEVYPKYGVGDIAKELGKRWEKCPNKKKFEVLAKGDKERYEKDMVIYKAGGTVVKKQKPAPAEKPAAKPAVVVEEEEDDDDDDDDDDDEDDDDDDDDE